MVVQASQFFLFRWETWVTFSAAGFAQGPVRPGSSGNLNNRATACANSLALQSIYEISITCFKTSSHGKDSRNSPQSKIFAFFGFKFMLLTRKVESHVITPKNTDFDREGVSSDPTVCNRRCWAKPKPGARNSHTGWQEPMCLRHGLLPHRTISSKLDQERKSDEKHSTKGRTSYKQKLNSLCHHAQSRLTIKYARKHFFNL